MGSAVVGADLIAAVESAFSVPVIEAYGLTEGGGPLREPMDGGGSPLGSCGLVAPEVDVKLVGAEGKEDDREGELWVRSPAVLSGYNNRPELDAERLWMGISKRGTFSGAMKTGSSISWVGRMTSFPAAVKTSIRRRWNSCWFSTRKLSTQSWCQCRT